MFLINLDVLITTVSASTAAIVAIVGGLIISRLLSLSSEKNGVIHRLKESIKQSEVLKEKSIEISAFLLRDDAQDFIGQHGKAIFLEGIPFEELVNIHKSPYRSADELRPFIKEFIEVGEDFYKIVTREEYVHPDEFERFCKEQNLTYPDKLFYYETIFDIFDDLESQGPLGTRKISSLMKTISVPDYGLMTYREQRSERDRLNGEISLLTKQIEVQMSTLSTYGKPDGLWLGLLVIMYACIVSIVWPCTLLPYDITRFDDILTKWTVLGFFFSALLFLFIYIGWSAYRITRVGENPQ